MSRNPRISRGFVTQNLTSARRLPAAPRRRGASCCPERGHRLRLLCRFATDDVGLVLTASSSRASTRFGHLLKRRPRMPVVVSQDVAGVDDRHMGLTSHLVVGMKGALWADSDWPGHPHRLDALGHELLLLCWTIAAIGRSPVAAIPVTGSPRFLGGTASRREGRPLRGCRSRADGLLVLRLDLEATYLAWLRADLQPAVLESLRERRLVARSPLQLEVELALQPRLVE